MDNSKRLNDTFGQGAGDTMLNSMAKLLRCRAGPEQLRRMVKQLQVLYASRVLGRIALSLSFAGFPQRGSPVQSLLAASCALCAAIHGGPNCAALESTI